MYQENNGQISPDGRWLAYQSMESGRVEVYVRPFPDVDSGRWQVSTAGGRMPLWSRDGKELFFVASEVLMGVRVEAADRSWRNSTPSPVLQGQYFYPTGNNPRSFDIAPDGRRFLMIKQAGADTAAAAPGFVVVQNWFEELKRLLPAN